MNMTLKQAARELDVSVSCLRRWIDAGAPVARSGRRGRNGAALVAPEAVARWRASRGVSMDTARKQAASELAARLPELLAGAFAEAHAAIVGPDKRRAAGYLAGAWYLCATRLTDELREVNCDVPEIDALPPEIARLRKIAGA